MQFASIKFVNENGIVVIYMLSWLYAEEGSSKQRDTQKMKLFKMSQREIKSTRNPFLFHLSADHAYNEIYFVYSQHLIRALIHDAGLHFIVEKHVTRIITGNAESVTIRRQVGIQREHL